MKALTRVQVSEATGCGWQPSEVRQLRGVVPETRIESDILSPLDPPPHLLEPPLVTGLKIKPLLTLHFHIQVHCQHGMWCFPGGSEVKNCLPQSGDTCSIPGPGRSHLPQGNMSPCPWLLCLCSRAQAPQLLEHTCSRACAPHRGKPPQWEARAPQLESSPWPTAARKKAHTAKDPAQPKNK